MTSHTAHGTAPETRVALVSGASRGIGAAIAERLHNEGWALSLGMRQPVIPGWADQGQRVQSVEFDACDTTSEARWMSAASERFSRLDAVIASAGLMIPGSIIDVTDEELDAMWQVNAKSPRRLIAAAWPHLQHSGYGRVIIVGSLSGKRVAASGSSAYAMTKHAAVALAHATRKTGWDHGIRATALCPGLVATDMARQITDRPASQMTTPGDVAHLASLALNLPNQASMAELSVNCDAGELF